MIIKTKYDIGEKVLIYHWGTETEGVVTCIKVHKSKNGKQDESYCVDYWDGDNFGWRESADMKKVKKKAKK